MSFSTRFYSPQEERPLPLRPMRTQRIELESSQSREALVLENSQLKEQMDEIKTENDILYAQVAQYSGVLAKYKEYEEEASKGLKRIHRAVRTSVGMHEDVKTEVEQVQTDAHDHWKEFVRMKRSSGVSVNKVMEEIKNRVVISRSSDIDIGVDLNMI